MSDKRTISHHLLRRTARTVERRIEASQRVLHQYMEQDPHVDIKSMEMATRVLAKYEVKSDEKVKVESTVRGPWGWRVVTY